MYFSVGGRKYVHENILTVTAVFHSVPYVAPHLPCIVVAVLVHAVALVPHVLARVLVAEARERDRVLQEHRVILKACPMARRGFNSV